MVAYHAPKVYRSPFGCCICKAKSSSSRFTDSSRYESDFVACFKLEEQRYGEICNACVLLIKRYKKLPVGTKRNWNHVVDARARPRGRATIVKYDIQQSTSCDPISLERFSRHKIKKHKYIRKMIRDRSPAESEDQSCAEDRLSEASVTSVPSSRAPSPSPSPSEYDSSLISKFGSSRRKQKRPSRFIYKYYGHVEFIDYNYWKKEKVCCGYIFTGLWGEVMVDPSLFKPCCAASVSSQVCSSPGSSEAVGSSDGGSFYDDEGLESLDEASSVDAFYEPLSEESETSLLTQLAAVLGT